MNHPDERSYAGLVSHRADEPTDTPDNPDPGGKVHAMQVAAFFDLDKTIIARSSTYAFSRPFYQGGLINRRAALRSAYAQLLLLQGGADADQIERMRAHLTALCQGWAVAQVRAIVDETLHDVVDPLVYLEAAELIGEHRALGHDVVVVSASGAEIVAPIARMVGVPHEAGDLFEHGLGFNLVRATNPTYAADHLGASRSFGLRSMFRSSCSYPAYIIVIAAGLRFGI